MPNVGRPSRACHACRERRVKCDFSLPECQRCLRRGHACPGYRDELELRFRTASVASYESWVNRGSRKNASGTVSASISPVSSDNSRRADAPRRRLRWTSPRVAPVAPLREPWNSHFAPLVMNQFTFGQATSIYTFIPTSIARAGERSALLLACHAIGAAHLDHTASFSTHGQDDSMRTYNNAIATVNSSLGDPRLQKSDNILLGVWLLSLYEFLWGTQFSASLNGISSGWDVHGRGMLELIRLRSSQQFATREGRNLFWMVYNTIQVQQLLTGQGNDPDTISWLRDVYEQSTPPEYLILRTAIFSYHCIRLCHHIHRLLTEKENTPDQLLSQSPHILGDLSKVESITYPFPSDHPVTSHTINPPKEPYSVPAHMGLLYIGVHTYQCFFRMQLCWRALEFLREASSTPGCSPPQKDLFQRLRSECIEDLGALADKVLAMLASSFGIGSIARISHLRGVQKPSFDVRWSDAIRILPPIRLIATCPFMLTQHREAANKVLDFVRSKLGVIHVSPSIQSAELPSPRASLATTIYTSR